MKRKYRKGDGDNFSDYVFIKYKSAYRIKIQEQCIKMDTFDDTS